MTTAFPKAEVFGLTTQLRRAGVSVAANIAEGSSRSSGKDQARFFEMAYGSLNEIATMFHIALGQRFVGQDTLNRVRSEVLEMCKMLSGLRQAALARAARSLNSKL
jgi:four helix bundle protein